MEEDPKNISTDKYKEILDLISICCVDLIIKKEGKILLVKRANEPLKGKFWLPGGRVYKNETCEDAAIRKAKEELGLDINIERKLCFFDFMSEKGPFENLNSGVHTISIPFLASLKDENQ